MKRIILSLFALSLLGCADLQSEVSAPNSKEKQYCLGTTELPQRLEGQLMAVEDEGLLKESLGAPSKGKLCQGKVYKSTKESNIILYRAWNSTNPKSQFGKWWALHQPNGSVEKYRSDYEICYQWSPLDKLVQCALKPGTKVVVGTGQSAKCSDYLSYKASDKQQIYIENARASTLDCQFYDAEFSWSQKNKK